MRKTTSRKRKEISDPAKTVNNNQHGQDQSEDVWTRPNWPPRLEKVFVELLVEEMKYYPDVCATGFNEHAWDHVCKEFNEETSLNYDKMELKKHLAVLRKRYRIVKPPYDHGGFGWDYRRKMVDVDDGVWQEYIEVHPEIKPYRKWGCPIYDELCTIFTKPIATGEYAIAVGGGSISYISRSKAHVNHVNVQNKRQSIEPSSSGPNVGKYKGAMNSKGQAVPTKNSQSKSEGTTMPHSDEPYSIGHCITVINGMQGVDRGLYNAAINLFQNAHWRKTFMLLKGEKRLSWLKAMQPNIL